MQQDVTLSDDKEEDVLGEPAVFWWAVAAVCLLAGRVAEWMSRRQRQRTRMERAARDIAFKTELMSLALRSVDEEMYL